MVACARKQLTANIDDEGRHLDLWGADEDGHKVYCLHEGQQDVMTATQRFIAAIAGTGGGKTAIGALWLMNEVEQWPEEKWMVLAPTYKILSRATVPMLIDTFKNTSCEGAFVGNEYRLPDGGLIYCLSADNEQGIEGGQVRGAWLDEAGQMTLKAWIALQGRLGLKKGRALLTTTPYAVNWLKRDFLDRYSRDKDPDYYVRRWSSILNPIYPKEEYERAKRTLPLPIFQMRYDAMFTQLEGRIFTEFDADYNVRPCSYDRNKAVIVGSDFNVNPMAWILCHSYGDHLEVFDELYLRDTTTQRSLDVLSSRYPDHAAGWQFYGDATGRARNTRASDSDYIQIKSDPRFIEMGRTCHYPKANPVRADRFAACNAMFRSAAGDRRCFVDPGCENLITDLESRFYKLGSMDPDDTGDLGHPTDALGYAIYKLFPVRIPRVKGSKTITSTAA